MNLYRGTARSGAVELDGGGRLAAAEAKDGRVLVAVRPSAFTVHTRAAARQQRADRLAGCAALAGPARRPDPPERRRRPAGARRRDADRRGRAAAGPGAAVWLTAKATDVATYPDGGAQPAGTLIRCPTRTPPPSPCRSSSGSGPVRSAPRGTSSETVVGGDGRPGARAARRPPGAAHGGRVASFLVDGQQAADTTRLHPGAEVDVLPPFAGGSAPLVVGIGGSTRPGSLTNQLLERCLAEVAALGARTTGARSARSSPSCPSTATNSTRPRRRSSSTRCAPPTAS